MMLVIPIFAFLSSYRVIRSSCRIGSLIEWTIWIHRRHHRDVDPGVAVHQPGPPTSQHPSHYSETVDGAGAAAKARWQLRRPAHHRAGDAGTRGSGERAGRQLEQIRGISLADQSATTGRFISRWRPRHRRGDIERHATWIGQHPNPWLRTGSIRQFATSSDHEQ